ncbi:RHS repeat-associated core domain-containing protein [Denitratimonas tolerans]|uniref:RHS repeat-associated core domain-containing protein n=1 Tax=Denitratimonas tolerans TaxID=1338420 RepID=A0AAW9R405_9GAMM
MPYGAPYSGVYREGPGFAGHVTDTQTNLTYMQQRYYDPIAQRFLSPDPVDVSGTNGGNFNRYWYANNNPYRYRDPDGRYVESIWDAASLAVGVVSLAGNVMDGNWSGAAADVGGIALDTAALIIPVVPGGASVAIQASRAGSNIVEAGARGRASETRVLSDLGEAKNTEVVSTSQGRTIPDFQNSVQVGEIKDTARVSDSSQLRAQREHAQATGREHVVVTGTNTQVSGTVRNQSKVIRRDDLGPGGK